MEHFPLPSLLEIADLRAWSQMEHFRLQSLLEIADFRAWVQMEHFPKIFERTESRRHALPQVQEDVPLGASWNLKSVET